MSIAGRLVLSSCSRSSGASSTRNRRSDSGEMSRERLPSDLRLLSSSGCGVWTSLSEDELDLRLKSFRGENSQRELGEGDLAGRFCGCIRSGAVPSRRAGSGGLGAGLGETNLLAGSMVLKSSSRSDVNEALRFLFDCSTGIQSVLTVWPGRYGQVLVEGCEGSWVSEDASSSYYMSR
jgi:hypothetical protein